MIWLGVALITSLVTEVVPSIMLISMEDYKPKAKHRRAGTKNVKDFLFGVWLAILFEIVFLAIIVWIVNPSFP